MRSFIGIRQVLMGDMAADTHVRTHARTHTHTHTHTHPSKNNSLANPFGVRRPSLAQSELQKGGRKHSINPNPFGARLINLKHVCSNTKKTVITL